MNRRPRPRLSFVLLIAPVLAHGCQKDAASENDDVDPAVLLALDQASEADAVVPVLIERQRALFDAINRGDSDRLAEMLQTDFEWNGSYGGSGIADGAADADYLAMLAGFAPASVSRVPSTYGASILFDGLVWVYAQREDGLGGVATEWKRTGGEWRASWSRDVDIDMATWEANRAKGQRMRSR